MFRLFCVALLASVLSTSVARAADVNAGQQLAERWCASCHVVSPTQRQGTPDVAPFSAVARIPSFDAHKLAFFLLAPHPRMPDMSLSRQAAEDLAAFIAKQAP